MTIPASHEAHLSLPLAYHNIVDCQFMQRMLDEGLRFIRGDGWISTATEDSIPGEVLLRVEYSRGGSTELLLSLAGALVHVVRVERAVHLRVAAASLPEVERATDALREALPLDQGPEEEVPMSFSWWNGRTPEDLARLIPAPATQEIELNYSSRTWNQLETMMSWTAGPAAGGRLVLWHGAPGTGKTNAVRALARAWRTWADFQFITDPEMFLQMPSYMLSTVAARSGPSDPTRWRVLVLEDSGEFLAPDAKQLAGQSLSRLLNVCDGVLGQATRSLVLITTNEHLRALHPAVSRPGRCLAAVEFHELNRHEIAAWCSAHSVEQLKSERAPLADLFAHAEDRRPAGRGSRDFGFATAA